MDDRLTSIGGNVNELFEVVPFRFCEDGVRRVQVKMAHVHCGEKGVVGICYEISGWSTIRRHGIWKSWSTWKIGDAGSGRKEVKEKGNEEDWVR